MFKLSASGGLVSALLVLGGILVVLVSLSPVNREVAKSAIGGVLLMMLLVVLLMFLGSRQGRAMLRMY